MSSLFETESLKGPYERRRAGDLESRSRYLDELFQSRGEPEDETHVSGVEGDPCRIEHHVGKWAYLYGFRCDLLTISFCFRDGEWHRKARLRSAVVACEDDDLVGSHNN